MRDVQRVALPLFLDQGFADVTVEQIAAEVGTAASTVYRHFGTKERIVLWDEHDVALDRALGQRLRRQAPLHAIRDAFVETLAGRYDDDLDFQLARIQFIYATEAVHAAAIEADLANRTELTQALRQTMSAPNRDAAPIVAGAALVALDVAIDRWQADDASMPLADLIRQAFATLDDLATLA